MEFRIWRHHGEIKRNMIRILDIQLINHMPLISNPFPKSKRTTWFLYAPSHVWPTVLYIHLLTFRLLTSVMMRRMRLTTGMVLRKSLMCRYIYIYIRAAVGTVITTRRQVVKEIELSNSSSTRLQLFLPKNCQTRVQGPDPYKFGQLSCSKPMLLTIGMVTVCGPRLWLWVSILHRPSFFYSPCTAPFITTDRPSEVSAPEFGEHDPSAGGLGS